MKLLLGALLIHIFGCTVRQNASEYNRAENECRELMNFQMGINLNGGYDERLLGKGYIIGCIDAKTKSGDKMVEIITTPTLLELSK